MQKPFSSFLPGVGGEWGTPVYVRRWQRISICVVTDHDVLVART